MMMDPLDRKTLEAHDNLLARRLVVMAWCYEQMMAQLHPGTRLSLPISFFLMGENLAAVADAMWQEHGDRAYEQRLADINQVAGARYN